MTRAQSSPAWYHLPDMPQRVRITDVSPRDGLQNEPGIVQTADKAELVMALASTGVDEIEASSFVSPKWVPQLGDAPLLFDLLGQEETLHSADAPMISVLVPNEKGVQGAIDANEAAGWRLISKVSVFTAASETFCKKNTNATIDETLERFIPVLQLAGAGAMRVRAYLSCAIACPFEGPIAPTKAAEVASKLVALGVDELDVADTIGVATPEQITQMLDAVLDAVGEHYLEHLTLHLHDTNGRAADCVRSALDRGVRSFDSAVAGLGGCPFASTADKRAPGNIDTGLLVRTIRDAGYLPGLETDIDEDALAKATRLASSMTGAGPNRQAGGRRA